jgi:FAD/FMN-containing dehydrogenase/Fe-S oxidoreductase
MNFDKLKADFKGEIYTDALHTNIYSTDASVYQIIPQAVAIPKNTSDLKLLIDFAKQHNTSLIPRTAGTSLAGQVVGSGIVVDVSKYFTKILNYNATQKTVSVQPGVIRDELNLYLKSFGVFFGPNTSTSNRCMIGGMVGNNSSGTTSIKYGTTRDKIKSVTCLLSDLKQVVFKDISIEEATLKSQQADVEGEIYAFVLQLFKDKSARETIFANYPKSEIHRRNTGYALDVLLSNYNKYNTINLAQIICGSEGTLGFITEIELQVDALPPNYSGMVAAHFQTIEDCMAAVSVSMQHDLYACEMMDDTILDCTKEHLQFKHYRFFIEGNPKAILLLEVKSDSEAQLEYKLMQLGKDLTTNTSCYAVPFLKGKNVDKAYTLRKAGLGLLGSMVGDKKAVACIEDTAVALPDLKNYINDFSNLMKSYAQQPVYYAHAGAGELHLRPILNLKTQKGVEDFKNITTDVAKLVKSYKGSFSGEHGDGIVRSNFIQFMLGDECFQYIKKLKQVFDERNIFNPGKIVNALPIDANFRYDYKQSVPKATSFLDFSEENNILNAAENCNGSGDCRKTEKSAGAMCPSYHATKNEKDTTRARANALRHFITHPESISEHELKAVFDLCLSCKACKRECPSNVDVSSLKAEVTYNYYKSHRRPIRDYLFGFNDKINKTLFPFRHVYNFGVTNAVISKAVKKVNGVHAERSLPSLSGQTFEQWLSRQSLQPASKPVKTIYLFVDEFTNRLESQIGIDAVELLLALGYRIKYLPNKQSGRALLSKGFLEQAKALCEYNVNLFKDVVSKDTPLIGLEPSAILSFRDDYKRLYKNKSTIKELSKHVFLIEEFLSQEINAGNITAQQFSKASFDIKIHVHCHQKALSNIKCTFDCINILENAKVTILSTGCCGMAGGFGYEKEHFEISKTISNLSLIPSIKKASAETIILTNGSSCRHQIKDFAQREALHPVSFLRQNVSK